MLFAELEMAANAAILNQLTNVQVIIGGAMVPGTFQRPSTVVSLGTGVADTRPTVMLASSAVMDEPVGHTIVVAGVPYTIAEDAPDGTGLTILTLAATE